MNARNSILAAALLALGATHADAGLTIGWYSVDAGGVQASSAGQLRLGGTIGQHDASGTVYLGNLGVTGGYWAGAIIACPADYDHTGFVDTDDFTSFVTDFETGVDAADFDKSGFVDTDDFTAFVLAFEAGC